MAKQAVEHEEFVSSIETSEHILQRPLLWQLLVLPDTRKKAQFNDRFFVPLGPAVVQDSLRSVGIDIVLADMTTWCCREEKQLPSVCMNTKSAPPQLSMHAQAAGTTNAQTLLDSIARCIVPHRGVLLSASFSSFAADDPMVKLALELPHQLKLRGVPYVILGGARCKRDFAGWLMARSDGLDAAFYHEMWSMPNESDLSRFLISLQSTTRPPEMLKDCHCVYRSADGYLHDLNAEDMRCYSGDERLYTPEVEPANVSAHSFTAQDLLPTELHYTLSQHEFPSERIFPGVVSVKFTDGCPNSCAFCDASFLPLKVMHPTNVVDYLERVRDTTDAKYFFFLNRQLNATPGYAEAFCEEMIERDLGILWCDSFNGDMWRPGLASLLREAGCIRACLGIETLSPRLRRLVGRPQDLKPVEDAMQDLHLNGIWVMANFIVGLPHETADDVLLTHDFLREHSGTYQWILLSPFKLYPRSRIATYPDRFGLRIIDSGTHVLHDSSAFSAFGIAYDEVGGRQWDACQGHIKDAYTSLLALVDPVYQRLTGNFPLLIACYEHFRYKKEVLAFISEVAIAVKQHNLESEIGCTV